MRCVIHPDMQEVVLLIIVQMVCDNKFVETLSAIANDDDDAFIVIVVLHGRVYMHALTHKSELLRALL